MGSGSESQQHTEPGTLSPVTATLLDLFGGNVRARRGILQPSGFGTTGYVAPGTPAPTFTPESFSALGGLLENQPLTGAESAILGAGGGGFGGGVQALGLANALRSQELLSAGADALPALLETDPTAAIAAANRAFTQETIPDILERAPQFSGSDLQRELARAGVDLQTNIAALKEANLGRVGNVVSDLPAFASAVGTNLLDQATQVLGFGQLGRELVRENTPAGDAFRVLSALQSLTGPSLTSFGQGSSKSTGVFS